MGSRSARFLTMLVPAGLEKLFLEIGKPGLDVDSPPPSDQDDYERLVLVASKYGV